jgi:hypothetical protein
LSHVPAEAREIGHAIVAAHDGFAVYRGRVHREASDRLDDARKPL